MVELVPVDDKEFDLFLERAIKNYADDKVMAGDWPKEGSVERSSNEFSKLLPQGRNTKDNYIYKIADRPGDLIAGTLWIAANPEGRLPGIFLYDIFVYEINRGRGFGRGAMEALEKVVKDLGYNRISLHVFGHNKVAIALYESCG